MAESNSSVDEWRKSVDKTLKYYKDKIKKLKSSNKSRVTKLQTSWHREKRVLNNKIKALQSKNEALHEKFNEQKYLMQREIRFLRKKLKPSEEKDDETTDEEYDIDRESHTEQHQINIHKIFDYSSNHKKFLKTQNEMNVEQNEIQNVTKKHSLRLTKWMKNTKKLMIGWNEMKNAQHETDKRCILFEYSDYKQLMAEQQSKMEDVSNYVSDLIAQKRKIKKFTERYETEIVEKNEMYKKSFMEYDTMRERRKHLYSLLLECIDGLNEAIDDENELNENKCAMYHQYLSLRDEFTSLKNELNNCSLLIKQYQKFDGVNDEYINEIQQYFKNEWAIFIASWCKWDHTSIICWIKYLMAQNKLVLSKELNLNDIERKMKQIGFNGTCFERIAVNKTELKVIGFEVLNDRQQIYDEMKELMVQFPHNLNEYRDEGQQYNDEDDYTKHEMEIPKAFLCPITHNIMMEPVQIFDDYTYERSAIITYLQKYNRSPITNENCDDDDEFMLVPNRKLAQKIQTFLYINPQITVNIKTPR